jgi:hypothetical protein
MEGGLPERFALQRPEQPLAPDGLYRRQSEPRRLCVVSNVHDHFDPTVGQAPSLEELARLQHAGPVEVDELEGDIWESDEELDAFLADLRASRNASIA